MIAYHVTARRNRDSIETEGLRFDPKWLAGAPGVIGYVWLFVDRDIAQQAADRGSWGGSYGDNDIWEVDVTGYDLQPDPHPGWGTLRPGWDDASRVVVGPIPSDRIRRLVCV